MDGVSPEFYVITKEHLTRLAELAIAQQNPPAYMSCDWLGPFLTAQRRLHGNSGSRIE